MHLCIINLPGVGVNWCKVVVNYWLVFIKRRNHKTATIGYIGLFLKEAQSCFFPNSVSKSTLRHFSEKSD